MNPNRFCIKFFTRPETGVDDAVFIDIFHEWIRLRRLNGVLLDVADYRHVPNGPGIMLITHEINYALDYAEGRFGLLAQRKTGAAATHVERILELVQATATVGSLLETDPRIGGRLRLEAGAFEYRSNDRLLAPNTAEAFARLQPELATAARLIYPGREVAISGVKNDPRDQLTAQVDSGALEMQALLNTVGVSA
jgi:hypothetical protein